MTLHEKFGWTTPPEEYLEALEEAKIPPTSQDAIPYVKSDIVDTAFNAAICYYLVDRKPEAAEYGRETVNAAVECFYGDWTKRVPTELGTLDPEWWRVHSDWIDYFRYGLCWSSVLGDWEAARRIAQYPPDNCTFNPGYTKEDEAAYLALAKFLRGGPQGSSARHFATIAQGKKEKPKFLAEVIQALMQSHGARFQEALALYLGYFRKREFRKKELDNLLCLDGTIFLHLGRKRGLEFRIPPEVSNHIQLPGAL